MLGLFKSKKKSNAKQAKILIVDDCTQMRSVLQLRLNSADYVTVSAENGEEGLRKAEAEKPDLILLDVNMPVMNGHQMLEQIKIRPGLEDIPIIMVTTTYRAEDIAFAAQYGIADYVVKPFSYIELLDKVAAVVGRT